jgi:hypothetical protein
VVLMMWHFRKIYRKCGAGEEWRISVEPIVWKTQKSYVEWRGKGTSYIEYRGREANWIGYILPRNCLLEHVEEKWVWIEVMGSRGRDVSS